MASIKERNGKYCVIYSYVDAEGKRKQKWETYANKADAKRRKKEVEYKSDLGTIVIPKCTTMRDLLKEYVDLYGKDKWAVSTHSTNIGVINNYILPFIGDTKLTDISTRYLEIYYQKLLKTPAVGSPGPKKSESVFVSASTIQDVHKLLRNCFAQAVKWEMIEKNPATNATVPKHKSKKREIWTAETLMRATELCEDEMLKLAMNLAFSGSLRIGELAALTWDCVDISPEAIEEGRPYIYINKEYQRVSKESMKQLDGKDILLVFPSEGTLSKTVRVLKTPKTESSVRRIYIPKSVAGMLRRMKAEQDELKEILGPEYHDYSIVLATPYGMPVGDAVIRKKFREFIKEHDLPEVVFHSLRHTSVTYKLKLNGGDIKAVQGDSGHSQVSMVTDVYSHIIDEDRRRNAELIENAFYGKQNLNPQIHEASGKKSLEIPDGIDPEVLAKVLSNPEMLALLSSLAKSMQK